MEETKRVGLVHPVALIPGNDVIFVMSAIPDARDERFPNTRLAANAQRMVVLVPAVEIAHHVHLPGAGRPDGKRGSLHAVFGERMSAQLAVQPDMATFVEQVKILIGK